MLPQAPATPLPLFLNSTSMEAARAAALRAVAEALFPPAPERAAAAAAAGDPAAAALWAHSGASDEVVFKVGRVGAASANLPSETASTSAPPPPPPHE